MAIGRAVVANDHPEQRLVIEQSGAGYCVPYEEAAFAQAIVALLRAPDLARAMGERGRRYACEHRAYGFIADGVERELVRVAAPAASSHL
jgi:glycosyltransferase involved in cell wall biosynthesis